MVDPQDNWRGTQFELVVFQFKSNECLLIFQRQYREAEASALRTSTSTVNMTNDDDEGDIVLGSNYSLDINQFQCIYIIIRLFFQTSH